MRRILVFFVMALLVLPVFAVFLTAAASSADSQANVLQRVQPSGSSDIHAKMCGSPSSEPKTQYQTSDFTNFPVELKSLQQETPICPQEQIQTRFDTQNTSTETTRDRPDQSSILAESLENRPVISNGSYGVQGSVSNVFTETFEGAFPGDNWWVGDANPSCASDYWDDTSYRAAIGSWSGWCAQVGDNSVYGGTNILQHKYDNYMDAYMSKKYTVDMSSWDVGYVDFYAWYDTESGYDYLIGGWYDGSSFQYDNNYKLTGTATSWPRYYWRIPDTYLISAGAFSFSFHSDVSNVKEGVYLDNINLVRADVTVDSYYLSPTSVHPGESFTAYYYVNNPCPFSVNVGLGLSIQSPGGTVYSDPAHDNVVAVSPGYSWISRSFSVSGSAPAGSYSVYWGIWSGAPGNSRSWGGTGWVSGQLTVAGWPDMMWTDIWTDPSTPTGGQNARVYCQIKNQGTDSTSTSFTNYFYVDGSYDSYGVNNGLAAGNVFNWYMDRTVSPGYHTILARADVYNNVQESNEANNDYSEKIWWKSPDLIVVDVWWIDAYGNRNPAITSGQPFTVYFQIKNNGDADATGTFTSYVFVDGWGSAAGSNNGLAAGAAFTWYTQNVYVSSTGSHTIRAVVDYNGAIAEANKDTGSGIGTGETNNERTVSFSVARASWTLLAYMDSDNNLEPYHINDFLSMAQVGSTVSVSVVVQMDRNPGYDSRYNNWADCRRFFITRGLEPYDTNALSSLGEVNMGLSSTLSDFATWAIGRFQADRYLLDIEDHGGSWVGCCWDDTNGSDRLDSGEIKSALSTISSTLGRKVDLVWFNDCLMGSIEIATQVYQYCNYMAASETVGWTDTWAYNTLLNSLVSNPGLTAQQYCIQITDLASPHDSSTSITQSVCSIDLSKTSNLVAASNSLSQSLKNNLYLYRSQIQSARTSSSWMEGPYGGQDQRIIDLYQFAQNIKNMVPDSTIQTQAQDILNQIGPAGGSTGYMVMRERHSASAAFCHGLSIYFPLDAARYGNPAGYTTNVDFTSGTQWDEFLVFYCDVNPPSNPSSYTSSHTVRVWSSDNTIEVTWSGASDDLSGVYGYSRIWDSVSDTLPDSTVDQTGTLCISFPVSTGNSWYLHVRTVDYAGNWNPSAYHVGPFYVDISAPNAPSISESHCGTSWNSHNSPNFEWSNPGDAGSGVSSYEGSINDGAPFSVSSPHHPTWSDGIYAFKVRAVDAVSLRSGWSNPITVRIDATAPSNPTTYSSSHTAGAWSNDDTIDVTWYGASDGSGSGIYGYSVSWTSSPAIPDTTVDSIAASITSSPLPGGWWYLNIRTVDNAGNWNGGSVYCGPFVIDIVVPGNPSSHTSSHMVNSWSADNTVDITWSGASDDLSGVYGYSVEWNHSPTTIPDTTVDTMGTSATSPPLADGDDWYFHVGTRDTAGNWANDAYHVGPFKIDTNAPAAPVISSSSHPSQDSWYNSNDPSFSWITPSDTSGVAGYSFTLDQSAATNPDESIDTFSNFYSYIDQAEGESWFHVRAKDNAGNWGIPSHYRVKIDTVAPSQPAISSLTHPNPSAWYSSNDPAFEWSTPSDTSGIAGYSYVLSNSPFTDPDETIDGLGNSVTYFDVPDGVWYFHVRARDNAGNWGQASVYAVQIDSLPPVVVGHTPSGIDAPVTSAITVTFNEPMDKISAENSFSISPTASGSFSWNGNVMIFTPSSDLSYSTAYTVTISTSARDLAGNDINAVYDWQFDTVQQATENAFLAVRGAHDEVYYRLYNSGSSSWEDWRVIPEGATCDSPAAAVCCGKLFFVVRGMDGRSLWFGSIDPSDYSFSDWMLLSGATPSAPTLVSYDSKLVLVVRGFNNVIYYRSYDCVSETWTEWFGVSDGATCDSPAAAVLETNLHLVVRGFSTTDVSGNNTLWHGTVNLMDDVFSGWTRLPGATPSAPALAVSEPLGNLYLSVRGMSDVIWINTWNSGAWQGWEALPDGATCDSPAATVVNGELHIAVRCITGMALWHCYINLDTNAHSGWIAMDGWTPSAPIFTR